MCVCVSQYADTASHTAHRIEAERHMFLRFSLLIDKLFEASDQPIHRTQYVRAHIHITTQQYINIAHTFVHSLTHSAQTQTQEDTEQSNRNNQQHHHGLVERLLGRWEKTVLLRIFLFGIQYIGFSD